MWSATRRRRQAAILARAIFAAITVVALGRGAAGQLPSDRDLDRYFSQFWEASNAKERAKAAERIGRTGVDFDTVYARLVDGRSYGDAPTGEVRWASLLGGVEVPTTVVVPRDYDPRTRYAVRVYLHGGVARPEPTGRGGTDPRPPRRRLESEAPYIYVYPGAFAGAQWWFNNQVENIEDVLDRLKRTYNVDENRIHLMGVSDGGTGVFFFGLREATPWSVLFPFNGHLRVLANPSVGADGELYASNLTNKPLYVINGGQDPLYPVSAVQPYIALLHRAGAPIVFRPQSMAGHDTSWWPSQRTEVDAFENEHPRDPLPDRLTWQTERTDRYNRLHWLVITKLGATASDATFSDDNTLERADPVDFGLRVDSRKDRGRRLVGVVSDTTAQAMGLRKGDLLVSMDGVPIETAEDIGRVFDAHTDPAPLPVVVERQGQRLELTASFPPPARPAVKEEAFHHRKASGRVELQRQGNTVDVRTRGVATFSLLLSPTEFDLGLPLKVLVNGKVAFEGRVDDDTGTLLRWAAIDNDRSMLFGAELSITVPSAPSTP